MFTNKDAWKLACELARSGDYANVVMIERELLRRGVLNGASLTTHIFRRELLTRLCHTARNRGVDAFRGSDVSSDAGAGLQPGSAPAR